MADVFWGSVWMEPERDCGERSVVFEMELGWRWMVCELVSEGFVV